MKKKNGFLAISVIFSFFVVFLMVLMINLTTYAQNRIYMNQIKKDIKTTIQLGSESKSRVCTAANLSGCPLCIRAISRHSVKCLNNSCGYGTSSNPGAGYEYTEANPNGDIIEYGNIGTGTTYLAGDAFDCDINGDKKYDERTERFYYLSPYYNPNTNTFNSAYASLVYYANVSSATPNVTNATAYSDQSSSGPVIAKQELPSVLRVDDTSYFKNTYLSLVTTTRKITTSYNTTDYGPTNFSYTNDFGEAYAARLITYQEIERACGSVYNLDDCQFLLENTKFDESYINTKIVSGHTVFVDDPSLGVVDGSIYVNGYWLENPYDETHAWCLDGKTREINDDLNTNSTNYGVRPVIEVPLTQIKDVAP